MRVLLGRDTVSSKMRIEYRWQRHLPEGMDVPEEVLSGLPVPEVVAVPEHGGSSHRFHMATLPSWEAQLAELWDRVDLKRGGLVFEISPEESFDPILMGPVFGTPERGSWAFEPGVAFLVHSKAVAEDLTNYWCWKSNGIPAKRRPSLLLARSDGDGRLVLTVDTKLHRWARSVVSILAEFPFFSAALLRTHGVTNEGGDGSGVGARLGSDRVAALMKAGLIERTSLDYHEVVDRYIEATLGEQERKRRPHTYVSRPFLLRRSVRRALSKRHWNQRNVR